MLRINVKVEFWISNTKIKLSSESGQGLGLGTGLSSKPKVTVLVKKIISNKTS